MTTSSTTALPDDFYMTPGLQELSRDTTLPSGAPASQDATFAVPVKNTTHLRQDGVVLDENGKIIKQADGERYFGKTWRTAFFDRMNQLRSDPEYRFLMLVAGASNKELLDLFDEPSLSQYVKQKMTQAAFADSLRGRVFQKQQEAQKVVNGVVAQLQAATLTLKHLDAINAALDAVVEELAVAKKSFDHLTDATHSDTQTLISEFVVYANSAFPARGVETPEMFDTIYKKFEEQTTTMYADTETLNPVTSMRVFLLASAVAFYERPIGNREYVAKRIDAQTSDMHYAKTSYYGTHGALALVDDVCELIRVFLEQSPKLTKEILKFEHVTPMFFAHLECIRARMLSADNVPNNDDMCISLPLLSRPRNPVTAASKTRASKNPFGDQAFDDDDIYVVDDPNSNDKNDELYKRRRTLMRARNVSNIDMLVRVVLNMVLRHGMFVAGSVFDMQRVEEVVRLLNVDACGDEEPKPCFFLHATTDEETRLAALEFYVGGVKSSIRFSAGGDSIADLFNKSHTYYAIVSTKLPSAKSADIPQSLWAIDANALMSRKRRAALQLSGVVGALKNYAILVSTEDAPELVNTASGWQLPATMLMHARDSGRKKTKATKEIEHDIMKRATRVIVAYVLEKIAANDTWSSVPTASKQAITEAVNKARASFDGLKKNADEIQAKLAEDATKQINVDNTAQQLATEYMDAIDASYVASPAWELDVLNSGYGLLSGRYVAAIQAAYEDVVGNVSGFHSATMDDLKLNPIVQLRFAQLVAVHLHMAEISAPHTLTMNRAMTDALYRYRACMTAFHRIGRLPRFGLKSGKGLISTSSAALTYPRAHDGTQFSSRWTIEASKELYDTYAQQALPAQPRKQARLENGEKK